MCSSFIAASRLFIVLFDFLLFWKRLPAGPVQLRWPMPSLFRLLRWPCRLFGWRGWKRLSRHWWVYCPFISLFVYWLDKICPKRGGGSQTFVISNKAKRMRKSRGSNVVRKTNAIWWKRCARLSRSVTWSPFSTIHTHNTHTHARMFPKRIFLLFRH